MNKEKDHNNMVPELRFPEFSEEWEKVKLKDVSTYFNGKSNEGDVQKEGKYELVTLKSIDTNGNLIHSGRFINVEVPTLTKGTLVMILSEQAPGLIGMTAIIPSDYKYVLNQRVAEIRPNHNIESHFLSMAINRNQRLFSKLGAGMKVQNISKPNVENYEFLFPGIEKDQIVEQQKIAATLTSLDDLIAVEKEKLETLQDHKKGLLQQLFPAKGEKVPKLRFEEFSGEWEETTLSKLGDLINGLTYSPKDVREKGLLVLRSSNVQNGQIDLKDCVFVRPDTKGANLSLPDDILICVRNGSKRLIGKNAIIPKEMPLSTHGAFMTMFRAKLSKFVFQLFQTEAYNRQVKADLGATINSINGKNFLKYEFIVPKDPKEQLRIADCFSSLDDLIAVQSEKIQSLKEHKKGLMQQMFPSIV